MKWEGAEREERREGREEEWGDEIREWIWKVRDWERVGEGFIGDFLGCWGGGKGGNGGICYY